jgi:tRNA U34 5-methylaminomethyl-2-thiouridine-forming methyltransferase MnmC
LELKREIIRTADGSSTIYLPEWNEHYHSKHGAIQEALHVFIKKGLQHVMQRDSPQELAIMEIGFGTGLNALLTALEAIKLDLAVRYTGIEAYPISREEFLALDYSAIPGGEMVINLYRDLFDAPWEALTGITSTFELQKKKMFFKEITAKEEFDLIFFDAFGPRVQPDLWEEDIFEKMYAALRSRGVLVTYSAKGSVRRAMQAVGFEVERLDGPPGKREMLRATRP